MSLSSVHSGTGSLVRAGAMVLFATPILIAMACNNDTVLPAPAHYTVQLTTATPAVSVGQDSSVSIPAIVIANGDTVANATTTDSSLSPTYVISTDNGPTGIRGTPPGSPAQVLVSYVDVNNNTTLTDTVAVTVVPHPLASIALSIPADTTGVANSIAPGQTRTVSAVVLTAAGDTVYCNTCSADIIVGSDTVPRVQRIVRFSTPDSGLASITSTGDLTADSTAAAGSTIHAVITVPGDSGVVGVAKYADTLAVTVTAPPAAPPAGPRVVGGVGIRAAVSRPHASVRGAREFRKGSGR